MSQLSTPSTRRQLRDRGDGVQPSAPATPPTGKSPSIRTRLSTGTLIMNGTTTVKEKDFGETSKLQKDTSSSGSKRKASVSTPASDSTPNIPPKRSKIGRNDGSGEGNKNDYFCWLCHKEEGKVCCCELCPRVYHLRCLDVTTVPKEWVCPECEKIMRAECADTRSKAMSMISIDTLCLLLRYALDRMRQPGSEVFEKPVDQTVFPNYTDYVFYPMDLSMLEKNIKKKEYGCTEAFLAEAKWILHNCIAFNGLHHKLTTVARNIVKSCKHEMSEIEVCPECYQNSCIKGDGSWFLDPCHPPHTLVWAKLKGYPFWPAKALQEANGQVDVRFFGAHDRSWVPVTQVFLMSKESPVPVRNNKGGFGGAMQELKQHIKYIKEQFGVFVYPPHRTPYDKRNAYMSNIYKNIKANTSPGSSAAKRSKHAVFGKFASKSKEADKVSAASKTASALKSKYSSLASKKSAAATLTRAETSARQSPKACDSSPASDDGQSSLDPSPTNTCETFQVVSNVPTKGGALLTISRVPAFSKVCRVSVTDVIQEKIAKIKELEEEEDEDKDVGEASSSVQSTTGSEGATEESDDAARRREGHDDLELKTEKGEQEGPSVDSESKPGVRQALARVQTDSGGPPQTLEKSHTDSAVSELDTQSAVGQSTSSQSSALPGGVKTLQKDDASNSREISERITTSGDSSKSVSVEPDATGENTVKSEQKTSASSEVVTTTDNTESRTSEKLSLTGSDYRDALTKTIEACKGKLGITEVEEIEDDILIATDGESDEELEDVSKINEEEEMMSKEKLEGKKCADKTVSDKSKTHTVPQHPPLERVEGAGSLSGSKDSSETDHASSAADAVQEKRDSSSENSGQLLPRVSGVDSVRDAADSKTESSLSKESIDDQRPTALSLDSVTGSESHSGSRKPKPHDVTVVSMEMSEFDSAKAASEQVSGSQQNSESGSAVSSAAVSQKDMETSSKETEKSGTVTASRLVEPILIDNEESVNYKDQNADNEPDLLMEVETEGEHDQLIIDLEADDLDLQAGERSKSGFVKELAPSASVLKNLQSQRAHAARKQARSETAAVSSSSSSSLSSVSSDSSPLQSSSQTSIGAPAAGGVKGSFKVNTAQSSGAGKFQSLKVPVVPPETPRPTESAAQNMSQKSTFAVTESLTPAAQTPVSISATTEADTALPSATKNLVNKYCSEIQQKLLELCQEVHSTVQPAEADKSRPYQQEMDRLKWIHQQEIAEIKHNYKLTITEMKATWEAEKAKSLSDLKKQLTKEKEEAVVATKKKQWCSNCLKEAIYYCCWNTSYCSYACQQQHWPTHLPQCTQAQPTTSTGATTPTTTATATAAGSTTATQPPGLAPAAGTESDVMVMSMSRGQSDEKTAAEEAEKEERIQAQKFNIPPPSSAATGDTVWRNRMPLPQQTLGQNLHFMPLSGAQQPAQPRPPAQTIQPLQYLQSLGTGSTLFTPNSQVQLLTQRPSLNTMLPSGTMMPHNAAVFPLIRPSQGAPNPGAQNIMITQPMQYQFR